MLDEKKDLIKKLELLYQEGKSKLGSLRFNCDLSQEEDADRLEEILKELRDFAKTFSFSKEDTISISYTDRLYKVESLGYVIYKHIHDTTGKNHVWTFSLKGNKSSYGFDTRYEALVFIENLDPILNSGK